MYCFILCPSEKKEDRDRDTRINFADMCGYKQIIMKWAQSRQYPRFEQKIHLSLCKPYHLHDNGFTGNTGTHLCITTATSSNWIKLHLCTLWMEIVDGMLFQWACCWCERETLFLCCWYSAESVFCFSRMTEMIYIYI